MPSSRKTPYKQPLKTHGSKNTVTSLIKFVAHSINRIRGKTAEEYLDTLYERENIVIRNPWRAVEVVSGSHGCSASKQIKNKRFLCDQAPKLPLPGCTEVSCACHYKHFSDRRAGPRRAEESGVHVHLLANNHNVERRHSRGRRSTDN
ncbi:MAG: hypothetical protein AB7T07_03140 [Steroidobacteraceae bacterium]